MEDLPLVPKSDYVLSFLSQIEERISQTPLQLGF